MMGWDDHRARTALRRIFDAAVESADAGQAVLRHLPPRPRGRCIVIGAGKASAAMAAALDSAWPDVDLRGVVVTRYGHAVPAGRIEIIEASHPVPDEMSVLAAQKILAAVDGLGPDDLVIALISGGGSALMVAPAGNMTLADKQAVNRALLASGATIGEMNAVRKRLSRVKGGRLALAAHPARVVTLIISDVPGDSPAEIASGPTVSDPTSLETVREIIARYQLDLPPAARAVLDGAEEIPPADVPTPEVHLIAAPRMALEAAATTARQLGLVPLVLGDALEGEAREVGKVMAGIALSTQVHGMPVEAPAVLLSGGETTVSIGSGPAGQGGRNMEFLLSLAVALKERQGIWAVAGDTDGIDGLTDAAGALIGPDTLSRIRAMDLDPKAVLAVHDSHRAFEAIGDLIVTGPTLTNVNDIRAILVSKD